MTPQKKEPCSQRRPPGDRIKQLAKRNGVCASVLRHTHVLQIVDDHQAMWLEARSATERLHVELRLRRQLRLAMVNFIGFETVVHGLVTAVAFDPLSGGFLVVAGALIMHITGRGL